MNLKLDFKLTSHSDSGRPGPGTRTQRSALKLCRNGRGPMFKPEPPRPGQVTVPGVLRPPAGPPRPPSDRPAASGMTLACGGSLAGGPCHSDWLGPSRGESRSR